MKLTLKDQFNMHKFDHRINIFKAGRMKSIFTILIAVLTLAFIAQSGFAAQRIFYEDCEDTSFIEHFLERSYGQIEDWKWAEFTSEVTRSTTAHRGNYSMVYNPFVTGDPQGRVGRGEQTYGNTSNFRLADYNSRYWYFRWYERWESGQTYTGLNKIIYINYGTWGDFTITVAKESPDTLHVQGKAYDTRDQIINEYGSTSQTLDDNLWHKIEVYVDAGTTGAGNGAFWLKVDDVSIISETSLSWNGTIHSNPIDSLTGWPSNAPGNTGSQNTWLDDFEIYILNGPNDIPGEEGPTPLPAPMNLEILNN